MHGVMHMRRDNTIPYNEYIKFLHEENVSPEQQIEDVKTKLSYLIDNFEDKAFYTFMLTLVEELSELDDFRICDKILYIESELWLQMLRVARESYDRIIEEGMLRWVYTELNTVWLRLISFEDLKGAKDEGQNSYSEN